MTKEQKDVPVNLQPFTMEQLPGGETVMRIRGRKHGVKLDVKLTLPEIERLFKQAQKSCLNL